MKSTQLSLHQCKYNNPTLIKMNTFVSAIIVMAGALLALATGSPAPGAAFAVGPAPIVAAPVALAAQVGYAHAVPQNVPPFASRVDISSRVRAAPLIAAAPYAVPAAPAVYAAGPVAAPILAHAAAAPYVQAPFFR